MATTMFRTSIFNKSIRCKQLRQARHAQSIALQDNNVQDAHYPPIKPKFPPGRWGKMDRKIAWRWAEERDKIAAYTNAKDKIKHLTENTYRVWKFNCIDTTPNLLDYQCKVTKTHIINDALPGLYNTVAEEEDFEDQCAKSKHLVIDSLIQEHELNRFRMNHKVLIEDTNIPGSTRNTSKYQNSNTLIRGMLTNLLGLLSGQRKDVLESHLDSNVKVSACWSRDGVLRSKPRIKPKDKNFIRQNNSLFYGEHTVEYQLRKNKPLPEFVPVSDELCRDLSYSDMPDYCPQVLGQFRERVPRTISAGFNIGDSQEYNHLSIVFLNNRAMTRLGTYGEEYVPDAERGYAMGTGFLSTVAQSHVQGFNDYEELTYPFTTQTILTDGQDFIFSAYQLNTLQLWKDNEANNLQNLCWITKKERLYEKYEGGKLVAFNDDLFKRLMMFFLIKPCDRNGIDLSPNLTDSLKAFDIPDRIVYEEIEEDFQYDKSSGLRK